MIDHNHPAVEAAAREIYVHDAPSNDPQTWPPTPDALADDYRGAARATLSATLPHLTAEDLRATRAGQALMAEGWETALTQLEMMKIICDWQGNSCAVENLRAAHERIMENAPYRKDDA